MTTKPRVLITESIADTGVTALEEGGIEVDVRADLDPAALLEAISDYDGLIVRSATKVTREVIEAGARLKVVGRAGIGVDNIDVDAATRRGIVVVNTPQGNIVSTAEHALGMLLALARQIPQAHSALIDGRWEKKRFAGTELNDKVLGIVGLGRVGTLVAQRCHALGMRIIARDPYVAPQRAQRLGIELVDFDELLARSDVISLHVVKTDETTHMLGEKELDRCKPGVLIVNVSRGGVIDEEALVRAIKAGKVGGAALDVFEIEPCTSSPLFDLEQVVVTPHIAGQTGEAQDKAGVIAAEQVLLALRGDFVPNAVNLDGAGELSAFVRPFLGLSTKLGRLASALVGGAITSLEAEYHGEVADEDTRVVTLSALRGFLQPVVLEPVTFVNAPLLARDRGIEIGERKSSTPADYVSMLRLVATAADRTIEVAGALFGRKNEERLVEIDGLPIDIPLARYMAVFRYEDRPGVIHRLTGPLAEHGINIATMDLGRPGEQGAESILALAVDSPIPPEVFEEAMQAAGIPFGRFVVLEPD